MKEAIEMAIGAVTTEIDAFGMHYRELNQALRAAVESGARKVTILNASGQRYIGTNLHGLTNDPNLSELEIEIHGTPGNDLGAFMNGPAITVHGSAMDGSGNTMNLGTIIVHGRAGDITGFSARGGEIWVRDNAGYRVGIHMKEYREMRPLLVIGGTTQDFLGEYMAGGVIVVIGLTLKPGQSHFCSHVGTGMHGGAIFMRGSIPPYRLGEGVGPAQITPDDIALLERCIADYHSLFSVDVSQVAPDQFTKLTPLSKRPYQQLYAY